MIIKLTKADFSAKSIGEVNVATKVSDFTKGVFTYMTRFSNNSSEAFAFDVFYNNLNTKGIWSKINKIYLPVLAKTKEEAFYDIVGNNGTYDIQNIKDDYMLFTDDGALTVGDQTESNYYTNIKATLATPINFNECTAIHYTINGQVYGKINGEPKAVWNNRVMSSYLQLGLFAYSAGSGLMLALSPATGYATISSKSVIYNNSGFHAGTASFEQSEITGNNHYAFYSSAKKDYAYTEMAPATLPNDDGSSSDLRFFTNK